MNPVGVGTTYARRRDWIARYFDERVEQWESLTGSAPVGRIRTTVRDGRRTIQDAVLSWLPHDLSGARVLDAGCGPGSFALRLAERGAEVVGIDVSAELTRVARERAASFDGPGAVEVRVGDMLDFAADGSFDYVVALDSLINYPVLELRAALRRIVASTRYGVTFTVAPRTPLLSLMHAAGKIFPRSNRAPSIEPVNVSDLRRWMGEAPELGDWRVTSELGVHRGFYISSALHLRRRASHLPQGPFDKTRADPDRLDPPGRRSDPS